MTDLRYLDTAWTGTDAAALAPKFAAAQARLQGFYDDGSLPLLRLPEQSEDLTPAHEIAARYRAEMSDVIVIGTGGSSLGAQTLYALADHGFGPVDGPQLHFMDNVDPATFDALTIQLNPKTTAFLIISKSGTTAETMTAGLLMIDWIRSALGEDQVGAHFTVITEPKPSPLTDIANRFGLTNLPHDPLVGGRFAVPSIVGLLPAMIAGLDVMAFRTGCGMALKAELAGTAEAPGPAMTGAQFAVAHAAAGRNISVMMPYCDRLADFGLWYRQLWAESIGKDGQGTTPVRAMGTVDQHSQLQLYKDGPDDKFVTVVTVDSLGAGLKLPADLLADDKLSYLRERTIGDLFASEARASVETLANSGRPIRQINLPALDMQSLGALMMHFMLETILAAELMGVNAFDQPAVEESKILTRQYMDAL